MNPEYYVWYYNDGQSNWSIISREKTRTIYVIVMSIPKIHFLTFFIFYHNIILCLRVLYFERQATNKKKSHFSSADLVDYYIMLLYGSRRTFDTALRRPAENRLVYTQIVSPPTLDRCFITIIIIRKHRRRRSSLLVVVAVVISTYVRLIRPPHICNAHDLSVSSPNIAVFA